MPATYRYYLNLVILELIGDYSLDDIRAAIRGSLTDPACPARPRLLIDFTGSEVFHKRTSDDIMTMSRFVASLADRFDNHVAIVAPKEYQYGLARMGSIGAEREGVSVRIFRLFDEARNWLLG